MLGVSRGSLKWLGAELVVVVLGILIAFQIEEWRSDLAERDRVAEALAAILADLEIGEREYDAWLEAVSAAKAETGAFLQLLWNSEEITEPDLSSHLPMRNYRMRHWAPTATAFNGARDNGDFAAINDVALQQSLVYYFDVLENFLLERRHMEHKYRGDFIGLLHEEVVIVPDASFLTSDNYSSRLQSSVSEFRNNKRLNNALVMYHRILGDQVARIQFGKKTLNSLRDRIEQHLSSI